MNVLATRIRRLLASCDIGEADRTHFVAFALAQSLANSLSLPASPVASVSGYYNNSHASAVNDILSGFNEKLTIDIFFAQALVKKCYEYRYQLVFEPTAEDTLRLMAYMWGKNRDVLPPALAEAAACADTQEKLVNLHRIVDEFQLGWKEELNRQTVIVG